MPTTNEHKGKCLLVLIVVYLNRGTATVNVCISSFECLTQVDLCACPCSLFKHQLRYVDLFLC